MHYCTTVCSQVVLIASRSPFNPSHTAIITSTMPWFFTSEKICSQNLAPSAPSPAQMPRMSRSLFIVTPMTTENGVLRT